MFLTKRQVLGGKWGGNITMMGVLVILKESKDCFVFVFFVVPTIECFSLINNRS